MKPLTLFLATCLAFTGGLTAQPAASPDVIAMNNPAGSDTTEIPQGVIRVRKAVIVPYVKVEYKYYLSHVSMVRVNIPVDNGIEGNMETTTVPVFDSSIYSKQLQRVYPKEQQVLLSKKFVEGMTYRYSENDTPRIDTMVIGMWINARGKVQRVLDDPEYTLNMPEQMARELEEVSQSVTEWGEAGGYYQRKRFLRKMPLILESYYCEVFVIVSSYPLTAEQQLTKYAPFDYPLNSPPIDAQQKASGEKNVIPPR